MRHNRILERWETGDAATCSWLSIGNSYSAEIAAYSGYDAVLLDLQHGMTDLQVLIGMLQAVSGSPSTPLVRVPSLDEALIMKVLDAGAYGVICPKIDSRHEAERLVAATRYPPGGERSFGPARALLYGGSNYFDFANEVVLRLAMIETRPGLAAVDEILAVEGLHGIFLGPNDLSLSLTGIPSSDPTDSRVVEAIARCLDAVKTAGKRIGIFCPSGDVPGAGCWRDLILLCRAATQIFSGRLSKPSSEPQLHQDRLINSDAADQTSMLQHQQRVAYDNA